MVVNSIIRLEITNKATSTTSQHIKLETPLWVSLMVCHQLRFEMQGYVANNVVMLRRTVVNSGQHAFPHELRFAMWLLKWKRLPYTERWAQLMHAFRKAYEIPAVQQSLSPLSREYFLKSGERGDKGANPIGVQNAVMIRPEVVTTLKTWFTWLSPTSPAVTRSTFMHWHVCVFNVLLYQGCLQDHDRVQRAAEEIADEDWRRIAGVSAKTLPLDEFIRVTSEVLSFWLQTNDLNEMLELLFRLQGVIFQGNALIHPYQQVGGSRPSSPMSMSSPTKASIIAETSPTRRQNQHNDSSLLPPDAPSPTAKAKQTRAFLEEVCDQLRADVVRTTTLWERQKRYLDMKSIIQSKAVNLNDFNRGAYGHSKQNLSKADRMFRKGESSMKKKFDAEAVALQRMSRKLLRGGVVHGDRTTSLFEYLQVNQEEAVNFAKCKPEEVKQFTSALDTSRAAAAALFAHDGPKAKTKYDGSILRLPSQAETLRVMDVEAHSTVKQKQRQVSPPRSSQKASEYSTASLESMSRPGSPAFVTYARHGLKAEGIAITPEVRYCMPPSRVLRPHTAPLSK
eukprot:PhF_6_TR37624/c0_g1_i1/m.55949